MSGNGQRKIAFITGGGSGIGKAGVKAFAAAGYVTVIADRDETNGRKTESEIREAGSEALFVACDVANDASVKAALEKTASAYGRLDAVLNAAGIDGEPGNATADCTLENWNRVIAIDLTGVFYCMRHQIPLILKSGGGAIVNISSTAGLIGAATFAAYAAAKHGVIGLTKTAALEYGKQKLRVNAICPGSIDTPMTQGMDPAIRDWLINESPVGRIGQPSEIAATAVFLCSDAAGYISGQAIAVDGAWTSR